MKSSNVLACLSQGAKIRGADWGTDIKEDGPFALMPHLSKCRELARVALTVAREHFDKGRIHEGLDLIFDVMALARHTGCDGTLIGKLVEIAITNMALDAISQELPRVPPKDLEKIDARIAALPAGTSIAEIMKSERMMLAWFENKLGNPSELALLQNMGGDDDFKRLILDPEKTRIELKKVAVLYDEVEKMMTVPYAELAIARKTLDKHVEEAGSIAKMTLPAMGRIRDSMDSATLQLEMTRAAVQIVLKGEAALPQIRDPFGDGLLKYKKLPEGFELTSNLTREGKPITHAFGEAARKAAHVLPPAELPPAPPRDEKPGDF